MRPRIPDRCLPFPVGDRSSVILDLLKAARAHPAPVRGPGGPAWQRRFAAAGRTAQNGRLGTGCILARGGIWSVPRGPERRGVGGWAVFSGLLFPPSRATGPGRV